MPQPAHLMDLVEPSEDALPDDLKPYFAKCRDKLGFLPNVLRAFLLRPEKLRTFIAHHDALMLGQSGLSRLEREMIAVAVSAANACYYCLVVHGAAVRRQSGDPALGEMIAFNYRVAPLDERQRAMLDFAVLLTEDPREASPDDRANLHALGFTDADIWDIAEVAAFFNYTNRIAHAVDMMPNAEYHAMGRAKDGARDGARDGGRDRD